MHKSTGKQRTTDAHTEECQIGLYCMYLQVKIVYGLPTAADIDNYAYKVGEVSMIIKRDYTIRNRGQVTWKRVEGGDEVA